MSASKTYVNSTENLWIRGVAPGEELEGDPDDPQIGRLLARGQIKPVKKSTQKKEEGEN